MVTCRHIYLMHISTWQCENLSTELRAFQNVVYSLAFSPARHRMCHRWSGDEARESGALSTVLYSLHTHDFCTICTLCTSIFTYCTWFCHQFTPVDSITYFRLFVEPATSASKARSMRNNHFIRVRKRAHNRGCALLWVNHIKPKLAHRGINQAYCRVYHPAMTSDLTLHYNVTRDKNNRQRSVP